MASTATPSPQILLFNPILGNIKTIKGVKFFKITKTTNSHYSLQVHASKDSQGPQKAPSGVDTRIHWENEDEGWIGGSTKQKETNEDVKPKKLLGEDFADLLSFQGSHYEFLGVSPESSAEEIKVAFRKLSKEYHPDTTALPLKTASEKFMKLKEVYTVLSNEESRRFYDWTLAQEVASRQQEKLKIKFEDPYEVELKNYEPVPDMVDRLGGKNMKLSDQAVSAITIDVFIIIFAICCITYVVLFKEY